MVQLVLISPPSPHRDTPDPNGLPLGLCMLATMVGDIADVGIIDAYSRALSVDDTISEVLEIGPDIVGISLPFSFIERTGLTVANRLKSINPELIIIMGGIQATLNADKLLANRAIDAVALGEAEWTIVEIMDKLSIGGWDWVTDNLPDGLRVIGKDNHPIGKRRPFVEDLDTLPSPSFDLLAGFPEKYNARLLTSRGCKFRCPYCASAAYWGHIFRAHSPSRVVDDMRSLRDKWGISRVSFSDDTINLDPTRMREIARMLIDANLGVGWGASCRPELLSDDDLRLYVKAGMTGLFIGLESGSSRILKSIHRAHDLDKTRDIVALAVELGVDVHASFMIGLPDEREDDIELTLEYAKKIQASSLGFHIYHPLPGSEYGENPEKYGITMELPDSVVSGIGAIDSVAPIRTKYLSPMRILDYYYIARGIADERRLELEGE